MNWKVCSLIVLMILPIVAILSGAENSARTEADWHSLYARPTAIPYPEDDPYSAAKAELGRALFFDPRLSGARNLSCASCHNPGLSWADGLRRAQGAGAHPLPHRTPTLLNVAWVPSMAWDGKFPTLEDMVFAPIGANDNMNLPKAELIARLKAVPGYVGGFADAFPDHAIDEENIKAALATFVRSIVSGDAPFDHWLAGDANAISASAKRGFEIFNGKGRCASCHSGWAFSDSSFHDIGVETGNDLGRGRLFPTSVKLRYAFKTPTLRDVARRGPYMHDGSVPTLEAVVDLYNRGGIARPSRAEAIRPLGLSEADKADLVAFLRTLSSPESRVDPPVLPK